MKEKKIKVGYLPLYIQLYDDDDPHYRDPMVSYMEELISKLEQENLEIIKADVCRVKDEFHAAVKLFEEMDVDVVVTQHLAYSPSLESIDALISLKADIVILDTTKDYDLIGSAAEYNGIDPNHGIHGVMDMCNLLKRNGRQYSLCVGHTMNSDVISEVVSKCRAAAIAKAYRHAKVGSAGGAFEGMGDFLLPDEEFKKKIGAEIIYLTKEKTEKYVATVTEAEIDAEIAWDKENFTYEIKNEEYYRTSVKAGLTVRKWVEEENLTAITLNFLSMDECGLPTMPFVECSKMLARGIGYAGEGDVLTAGLVGALQRVYGNLTTFTEMFCPDWKNECILLSHMGESNLALAQWKPVLRNEPFGYNSYGHTATAYTCMRPGKAIYLNLAPINEGFMLILSEVEMLNVGLEFGAYRYANQGWMKPPSPLNKFLKEYSMLGGTHHGAMIYGADIEEIKSFGEMMGFQVQIIK